MNKKIVFALTLVMLMVLSVFVGSGTQITANSQKKFVIGFSIDTMNNPWRATMVKKAQEEAAKYPNVVFIYTDGQDNTSKQISDVEDLMAKRIDALLISPHEGQPLTPIVTKAYQSGIPVIVLDRTVEGDQYTTFIGADNKVIGKQAGEFVAKYMNQNKLKNIVMIQGTPGSSPCLDRGEPFAQVISQNPGLKIVAKQTANWDQNQALQVMENLLQANPKGTIDMLYTQADNMALGALKAIKAAGRNEIKIISVDGQKQAYEAIKSGEMLGTFIYPFPGALGVQTALKILNGKKVGKKIDMQSILVTKDNVDKYYDPNAIF